jgi:hypothetical protein
MLWPDAAAYGNRADGHADDGQSRCRRLRHGGHGSKSDRWRIVEPLIVESGGHEVGGIEDVEKNAAALAKS